MSIIYTPQGKAREYSPLALNHYSGCDHGCTYCYVPVMMKRFRGNYVHDIVEPRPNLILQLRREIYKFYSSKQPVLLSFTCDPYCHANEQFQLTRKVLEILLENKIPVSILTKGGSRCLQDIDIFKRFGENIQIGATLTCISENLWYKKNEPNVADPQDRIATLKILKNYGLKTWVSFEPVINPAWTSLLIDEVNSFIDIFKIGKLNHDKEAESKINWAEFLKIAVIKLRKLKKSFYIKKDLAKYDQGNILTDQEKDMDYLNLKPWVDRK